MLYIVLGILLGIALAIGPLQAVSAPVDSVAEALVALASDLVVKAMSSLGGVPHTAKLAVVLSVALSTVAPGAVALTLVLASRAGLKVRKAVAVLVVLLSLLGFAFLSFPSALALFVGALILSALVGLVEGLLVTLPLMVVATVVGIRYSLLIWNGHSSAIAHGAISLGQIAGGGTDLWRICLVVVALVPFGCAAVAAIKD